MTIQIIPTIVPQLLEDVRSVSEQYAGFSSYFQIDVADGNFAPNKTWLPQAGERLPEHFKYEVHMMVSDPQTVGTSFADAGAHTLIAHIETIKDADVAAQAFADWRARGVQAIGIAVLLQTPLRAVESLLPFVDFVLLMTIARIGVQGIPFEAESIERVSEFSKNHPEVTIAVDGGVSEKNIEELVRVGARRFGIGSAIAKSPDPKSAYQRLKTLAENALQ